MVPKGENCLDECLRLRVREGGERFGGGKGRCFRMELEQRLRVGIDVKLGVWIFGGKKRRGGKRRPGGGKEVKWC